MSKRQILLSAANGPVIGVDDTGVVMNLSDRVIRDIARRLPTTGAAPTELAAQPTVSEQQFWLADDIDWWNARSEGDWVRFDARLPGTDDSRRYARHASGAGVLADAPGALLGLISLAGPRRYTQISVAPDFPYHIVGCPPPEVDESPLFANLGHRGIDTGICDRLLARRHAAFRRLPLHVTQPCLLVPSAPLEKADLTEFTQALNRIATFARELGRPARIIAVAVELGPQHVTTGATAEDMHLAVLGLLDRVAADIRAAGMGEAPILLTVDAGAWWNDDAELAQCAADALQRLILCPGAHVIVPVGSTTGLEQDDLGLPSKAAMAEQILREVSVIERLQDRQTIAAPVLYLAERIDPRHIKAIFKVQCALSIDAGLLDQIGPGAGFSLRLADTGEDWPITSVEIDPGDSGTLILAVSTDLPENRTLWLDHALPLQSGKTVAFPATSISETFTDAAQGNMDEPLRLWAMPASMEVR